MAKRSDLERQSEWVEDEEIEFQVETLEGLVEEEYPQVLEINLPQPSGQLLALNLNMRLNIVGSVTGNRYTFNGAGSTVFVDEKDVPAFLAKTVGRSTCCGGKPAHYFSAIG